LAQPTIENKKAEESQAIPPPCSGEQAQLALTRKYFSPEAGTVKVRVEPVPAWGLDGLTPVAGAQLVGLMALVDSRV
jgi:hypothetical protein